MPASYILPLKGTGLSVATSQPLIDMSQTWTASGVTYTGWKLNITDTASAAASLLVDLQVGGTSKLKVSKAGDTTIGGDLTLSAPGEITFVGEGIFDTAGSGEFRMRTTGGANANLTLGRAKTVPVTVATLASAATAGAGARAFVTDANATTFASIVASGGANGVPVYSDGTNWRIG